MQTIFNVSPEVEAWLVIPALIFFARILDVSIGTMRIVFIARGAKGIAPLLGFFEVLIWLIAMGQIMQNLSNIASYLAWASGFAVGNYVGLIIEEKLAIGNLLVRVITAKPAHELIESLKKAGFGVTSVDAFGAQGPVNIIFTLFKRKDLEQVLSIVKAHNPNAFYTIENVRYSSELPASVTKLAPRVRK
ncbi:DUF2179 domain-containing protein [bacterium]|nr:DUF2179 domain-containing protein [bacterium]